MQRVMKIREKKLKENHPDIEEIKELIKNIEQENKN